MGGDEDIQEHLDLSCRYLKAAILNLDNDLPEPALFNAIHALELSIKALLTRDIHGPVLTHNVGGLLGKYYRDLLGERKCRTINAILIRYNLPRYPGTDEYDEEEISATILTIDNIINKDLKPLIER